LAEKYGEAQETIEELSATAAEEIDRRQQDIDSLNAALCEKTSSLANTSKRLQVIIRVCMLLWMDASLIFHLQDLSRLYDTLVLQHSELVDQRSDGLQNGEEEL
jgi:hypothetical protein